MDLQESGKGNLIFSKALIRRSWRILAKKSFILMMRHYLSCDPRGILFLVWMGVSGKEGQGFNPGNGKEAVKKYLKMEST